MKNDRVKKQIWTYKKIYGNDMISYIHMWGTLIFGQILTILSFFPMVLTLQKVSFMTLLLIMRHSHTVSAFLCVATFGTFYDS